MKVKWETKRGGRERRKYRDTQTWMKKVYTIYSMNYGAYEIHLTLYVLVKREVTPNVHTYNIHPLVDYHLCILITMNIITLSISVNKQSTHNIHK